MFEPHFVYSDSDFNKDEKLQRKEVLKESYNRTSYCILDGSHIFDDGVNQIIYREAYLIKDGKIENICDVGKNKNI